MSATEWRAPSKDEEHERTWRSALRQEGLAHISSS